MHSDYIDCGFCYRLYHLYRHESGTVYVTGNLSIEPTIYDPMENMPDIIIRLIEIGKQYEHGANIAPMVRSFCEEYGQLGFLTSMIEKTYDDDSVKFFAGNVLGKKAATKKELQDLMKPFPHESQLQSRRKAIERSTPDENGIINGSALDYDTCEAVWWYGEYGKQIYELLRKKQSGETAMLVPGNAELRCEIADGSASRRWYYDSLKSACDVWLIDMLTAPHQQIRLCKRCGKAFIAGNAKTEYCSASCRNVANVYNSRKRKRESDRTKQLCD